MEFNNTSIEIGPFSEEHLEETAALVAVRCQHETKHNPILPARFEDAAAVLPILHNNTRRQTGVVARREGKLIGFLTGFMSSFREVRMPKLHSVTFWLVVSQTLGYRFAILVKPAKYAPVISEDFPIICFTGDTSKAGLSFA